jgi:prepilin-type N-terminal cleavage/methylation domain-containing protein
MRRKLDSKKGYSLVEALVVIAIIGLISLVAVPNFIVMYRSAKIKAAVRTFANDLRAVRQEAVTSYRPMMVSIGTTATERFTYWIYQWDGSAWTPAAGRVRQLEPEAADIKSVYFTSIGFPDTETADGASRRDIIFQTNGSLIRGIGDTDPVTDPTVRIRTDLEVPKNEFIFTVSAAGTVKVE